MINIKIIYKIVLLILGLGFILTGLLAVQIYSFGWGAEPAPGDAIIVLGCRVYGEIPSPFLQERLNEALRLFRQGFGKYIIVSGGQGPGERITEAEAMKRYLVARGVEESQIILEDKSTSTMTNLINCRKKMEQYGLNKAVIVSNSYHLKRVSQIAKDLGISATYSGVFVENYRIQELNGFAREILAICKYYLLKY